MFLFTSFRAKPGAEPWRSGEVIRKYAGGSLKVFRRLNAGMFDCLTISVDRDQISKAGDGNVVGLHNTCDHTACLLGKMTKWWPQYESELCPDYFESKYVAHTTRPYSRE